MLIRVVSSCISAGTEISGVKSRGTNIIQRALQRPENVKKVVDAVKADGLAKTFARVESKLEGGSAFGYPASGIIEESGGGREVFCW